jgi:hypothetical protein
MEPKILLLCSQLLTLPNLNLINPPDAIQNLYLGL